MIVPTSGTLEKFRAPPMDRFWNVAAVRIAEAEGAARFTEFVKRDWSEGRTTGETVLLSCSEKLIHSGRLVTRYEEKR